MKILFILLITFLFPFYGAVIEEKLQQELTPEKRIAKYFKAQLKPLQDREVLPLIKMHYLNFKLMNSQGEWSSPQINVFSEKLLSPANVQSLEDLIDTMAENAEKNSYLHEVLLKGIERDSLEFYEKVQYSRPYIPYLATYALALNRITSVARENVQALRVFFHAWEDARQSISIIKTFGFLIYIKYLSVRKPLMQMMESLENSKCKESITSFFVPLNILEASLVDFSAGHYKNAKTGRILALSWPKDTRNPITITDDKNGLRSHFPHPKEWADLYGVWNLGFLSQYPGFALGAIKLLIPQVSGYQDSPEEYLYNRAIALYAYLNLLVHSHHSTASFPKINWQTRDITELFGFVNEQSTKHYAQLVKAL